MHADLNVIQFMHILKYHRVFISIYNSYVSVKTLRRKKKTKNTHSEKEMNLHLHFLSSFSSIKFF